MTRVIALSLLAGAAMMLPGTASAQNGRIASVTTLESRARVLPNDGGTQIELAQAYTRAGRTADADAAYRRALVLDNEMLETPTGDAIWSHQVATRALGHTQAVASR